MYMAEMGAGQSQYVPTVAECFEELQSWITCPGIGNGNFFPGKTILCKTNRCSESGQILLDTQNPTLRCEGGLKEWPIQQRHVREADNSPQKLTSAVTKDDDINVWLSVNDDRGIVAGKKRSKKYNMLFEQTRKLSVDIEHFREVFQDITLKQGAKGIQGETSFFVVTDVFEAAKVRCESSKRVHNYFNQKGSGMARQGSHTYIEEASQSSDTPKALFMKCAEIKYDPESRKITEIESCDSSKFRERYTLVDKETHKLRYDCRNNGDIKIAYKVEIYSGKKTSADVFLRLEDQDRNLSVPKKLSNPCCRRRFTTDREFSSVIRVLYRNTGGPNNEGQSAGDLVSKVHVTHDNSGFSPGWFLCKVVLQNLKTGRLQEFPFYRWLSRRKDDHRIDRVVTMMGSGKGEVRLYKVRVTTVHKVTDSPVIVCLYGSLGQSDSVQVMGELKIGRTIEFTIVALDLGDLQGVVLSHRGQIDWLLEKIEVQIPGSSLLAAAHCERHTWVSRRPTIFKLDVVP